MVNKNVAIITGAKGQIGSYLTEFLLKKDIKVVAVLRRNSENSLGNISHINDKNLIIEYGNIIDNIFINNLVNKYKPKYYFNLAAMSFVKTSFDSPIESHIINCYAVEVALEAIETYSPETRFLQASTSEMFGANEKSPQNEKSKMIPVSPYSKAKHRAYTIVREYRERDVFACNSICFNTESPRRGTEFVTRKITQSVARIKKGLQDKISLGNIEAKRDWSYVPDTIEGLWKIINYRIASDFVLATGETHTIREFIKESFKYIGIENWEDYIEINPKYFRPTEVNILCGDYSKAKKLLNWEPKVKFKELVAIMMKSDLQ